MPQLPTPFRVALGLVATALDEAKHLPDKAIELPMLAVSTALQMSLRAQQRYAALAARGDDLLAGRATTDDPPPWATFDEPVTPPPVDSRTGSPADGPAEDPTPADGDGDDEDEIAPPRKTVRRPRNSAPSRFDAVGDDAVGDGDAP